MISTIAFLLCFLPVATAEPEQTVEAARGALSRRWQYPWYDARTDGLRRIDVRDEVPLREPDQRGGAALGELLQVLGWAGIAILLGLMVWLMVVAWQAYQGDAVDRRAEAGAGAGPNHVEALPLPADRSQRSFLDEARRRYEQGDFSRAVVSLFMHQLLELDRLQIIRLARGKTNRQYLHEVGRRTALRQLVEHTMVAFEDVFFGNRQIDRARFEACWTRLGEFDALIHGGTA